MELAVPGFERDNYPDGLERDVYDARSLHCLLRHRPTGAWAGTVRLVCADPARMDAPFPARSPLARQIDQNYLHTASRLRRCIGECSRFILARQFRSRAGEAAVGGRPRGGGRRRSRTKRAAGPDSSGSRPPQGGHDHELGAAGLLLVRGDGTAAGSAVAPVRFALRPISPVFDYHGRCRLHWGYLPERPRAHAGTAARGMASLDRGRGDLARGDAGGCGSTER